MSADGDLKSTPTEQLPWIPQLFRYLFVARQVQRVAADVCRISDVLTQTILGEHVDGVMVEVAGDVPWHVEVADDNKSVAQYMIWLACTSYFLI